MPINEKMMREMKKQYGSDKGEDIYYALEQKLKKRKKKKKAMYQDMMDD